MKPALLVALLAAPLPLLAAADAADPAAPVPRPAYRSVFQDTPTGIEQDAADWKKANAEVGQFTRGHIDLLRWEERQTAPAAGPPAAAPAAPAAVRPATPAAPAAVPAAAHRH